MKEPEYYSNKRPEISDLVPGNIRTILDIGCSHGTLLKFVKEQTGAETWGIEELIEVSKKAKEKVDNVITGKIEDVVDIIPDDYFDCITLNDLLEHLPEPADILRKIRPKLSSEGIIIASIPNVRYLSNLYEIIIKKDWEYKKDGILDSTHLRFFTQKSMKRLFETAGYNLIKQVGINKNLSWKFRLFQLLTLGILNDTQYLQFICIAMAKKLNL